MYLANRPYALGRSVVPWQTTWYSLEIENCSFIHLYIIHMHATTWKFERKNSQEHHHMVWNGATNRPVEKDLFLLLKPPISGHRTGLTVWYWIKAFVQKSQCIRIIIAVWKGHYCKQIIVKVSNESWWTWTLDSFFNNLELYDSTEER